MNCTFEEQTGNVDRVLVSFCRLRHKSWRCERVLVDITLCFRKERLGQNASYISQDLREDQNANHSNTEGKFSKGFRKRILREQAEPTLSDSRCSLLIFHAVWFMIEPMYVLRTAVQAGKERPEFPTIQNDGTYSEERTGCGADL